MSKGQLSVGDDTPSGEPDNGPKGPYITDVSDDALADRKKPSDQKKQPIRRERPGP